MDRVSMQERFGIIGTSAVIRHVLDRVRLVAETDITVLIQGESGVGKELFAQAVHELSVRRHKKMLIVNCGAIPEGLIESELFGNEKGAYTGAVERRSGYFEESSGSSLFLDEIGEMPLTAQVRLLRVLETGEFNRVGSSTLMKTDVRVIASTNKDLGREVAAGRFREDLYYRLSTVIMQVPSLRERKEDILPIFESFQHRLSQKYNTPGKKLDDSARALLTRYRWPGNVRELRNVAEQTVVLLKSGVITADDIRPYLRGVTSAGSDLLPVRHGASTDGADTRERELIYRALLELRTDVRELKDRISTLISGSSGKWSVPPDADPDTSKYLIVRDEAVDRPRPFIEDVSYEIENSIQEPELGEDLQGSSGPATPEFPTLEVAQRSLITEALDRFEGNRRQSAQALGISERTLYRKLKEFEKQEDGID